MTDQGPRLRVGFVQTVPEFGDPAGNRARVAALVSAAPAFDVLVLPELFASGYLFRGRAELEELAEPADGPTVAALREWAAERGGWIAGGFPERAGGRVFNSAALAGPDGTVHVYRKIHLFDTETDVFDPGDRPFRAWTAETAAGSVRLGLMICFDWVFPESARSLALDGADVILHPSNLVKPWCQRAMRTRCLENGVYAVTANRAGTDDRGDRSLGFTGRSRIAGPLGDVLADAPEEGECLRVVEIDAGAARRKAITPRNDRLGDRRPELYRS